MPLIAFTREELAELSNGRGDWNATIRLQDIDAGGVVFFARYFELFNDALLAFAARAGHSVKQLMERDGVLLPVKHADAHYAAPLYLGDRVEVSVVRARVTESAFIAGYVVYASRDEGAGERVLAATGQTHHVAVDRGRFVRTSLPARFAAALREVGRSQSP